MIQIITGSLLDADTKYIAHQCNSIVNSVAHGIAYYIFQKFPYSECYRNRKEPDVPGTIDIRGNGQDQRYVINMFAQYYPGGHVKGFENYEFDGIKAREKFFHKCLLKIAKITDLESISFNYLIGCGLAGGTWEHYYKMIENFEKYVFENFGTKVYIYQREQDKGK